MIRSYGKMSNGELSAHEENVVSFLYADERFLDCVEDAEDLGVSLSVSVYRPHGDLPPSEGEPKFPYGYESELRVDFTSDGYILTNNPEEGRAVQMSVSAPLVRTVDSLLIKKTELIPYDELIEDESFFFSIEDFLDDIEDHGVGTPSPFRVNEDEHEIPEGSLAPTTRSSSPATGSSRTGCSSPTFSATGTGTAACGGCQTRIAAPVPKRSPELPICPNRSRRSANCSRSCRSTSSRRPTVPNACSPP